VVLKPTGGALFLKIEDVSEQRKNVAAIVQFHERAMQEASGTWVATMGWLLA
jgi:hypothetical protein